MTRQQQSPSATGTPLADASPADRIEKQVILQAPRPRVWRAISDAARFGQWFGVRFDGPFVEGAVTRGRIVPTAVDPDVARMQQPYAGMACDVLVEAIEPGHRLAFRWHPGGEPDLAGPMTLVEFLLEDADGGTLLTIVESGFDQIPLERRAQVFADNDGGWEMQLSLIARYLALPGDGTGA